MENGRNQYNIRSINKSYAQCKYFSDECHLPSAPLPVMLMVLSQVTQVHVTADFHSRTRTPISGYNLLLFQKCRNINTRNFIAEIFENAMIQYIKTAAVSNRSLIALIFL